MITFLLLIGAGIFSRLANMKVGFGGLIIITVLGDIYLTSRFITLYFGS